MLRTGVRHMFAVAAVGVVITVTPCVAQGQPALAELQRALPAVADGFLAALRAWLENQCGGNAAKERVFSSASASAAIAAQKSRSGPEAPPPRTEGGSDLDPNG